MDPTYQSSLLRQKSQVFCQVFISDKTEIKSRGKSRAKSNFTKKIASNVWFSALSLLPFNPLWNNCATIVANVLHFWRWRYLWCAVLILLSLTVIYGFETIVNCYIEFRNYRKLLMLLLCLQFYQWSPTRWRHAPRARRYLPLPAGGGTAEVKQSTV